MSQAEDLLDGLMNENSDEEHIIIGKDRTVTVPKSLHKIAVQYDHNVRTVTFDCPRYFGGVDLSTLRFLVNYMRSDGEPGSYPVDEVRLDETDDTIIHFDWVIKEHATWIDGPLTFLVCAKKTNAEGIIENHWNSELNKEMTISRGMHCSEIIVEKHPDVIAQILLRLDEVEDRYVFNATGAAINQVPTADGNGNWSWKGIEFPEPITDDHIRELITGYNYSTFSGSYNDLSDKPTIPEVSQETIENALGYVPPKRPKITTIELPASGWTGSELAYSQTVSVANVTENSQVDLHPSPAQLQELLTSEISLIAANDSGTVTVFAIGGKPSSDYTMQIIISEVTTS